MFFNTNLICDGGTRYFDPNYDMAIAFKILINQETEERDLLFLEHELFELKL